MDKERLFVIGLDAADPDLLDYWLKGGQLPFFEQLLREGTYCRLKCIPPTFSPVEWTSILTGTNPGKHGIFGFTRPVNGGRQLRILNRLDCKQKTFYDILAEAGRRVGLINMVMTYPAKAINGFMITGMETPDLKSPQISYPPGLIEELQSVGCHYQLSPGLSGLIMQGKIDEAVAAADNVLNERYKATKYLLKKYDCDVMVVLFSQIDNCGHYFWRFFDKEHPDYRRADGERYGHVMLKIYQKHEQILQDLMREYPEATFVICSDHGMGFNYEARYYVKELFTQMGWYTPADSSPARFSLRRLLLSRVRAVYWFIFKRFPMRYKQAIAGLFPALRSRVEAIVADVGWDRTRVYSNDDFFSIVINRTNPDGQASFASEAAYNNFRAELIETLYGLQELGTREPLVHKVHTRESLYYGPYVADAPDLIIEWADVRLRHGVRCRDITILPEEIKKSELHQVLSGEHRPYGILLLKGNMIQQNLKLADGSVLDIAPTILYLAGQPIPRVMDGQVLTEAFRESFRLKNQIVYTDEAPDAGSDEEFSYSVEESLEVTERLRSLGYIE